MKFSLHRIVLNFFVVLAGFSSLPASAANNGVADLDNIVAVVNDDVILRSELNNQMRIVLARFRERGTRLPSQDIIQRQVLESLISARLQLQTAKRAGITIDEAMLTRAIGNIAKQNDMTISDLRRTLQSEGMDYADFRDSTRQQMLTARLQNKLVFNRIVVTDREVDSFLKKQAISPDKRLAVHLLHILISVPEAASPERLQTARDKAAELASILRNGADFAEQALMHSEGRQALNGGDLGWLKLSQVPTLAAELVQEMEIGDISDPVRSSSGFHIIKLIDFKGSPKAIVTQTHARHILIQTNELISDQDARSRLEQLRDRILSGEDFETLARSHSDDKGSAIQGGDLGWVNPGDLVSKFEEEMNGLEKDEISEPFQTQFGWHIVQFLENRSRDNTESVLRSKAKEAIKDRKGSEASQLWLRRMRDEAYVELRLEEQ